MPSSCITVWLIFKAAKFFILSNYKRSSLEKPYMHPKTFFIFQLSDTIVLCCLNSEAVPKICSNLVTFPILKAEMAMVNLTRVSFPLVESQTFWSKTGAT